MSLTMLHLAPDLGRLFEWARLRGLPTGGDLGYACHSALRAAFGAQAPQPFMLEMPRQGEARILGYGTAGLDELRRHRETFANPLAAAAFPDAGLAAKAMPADWRCGLRLNFAVRVCPVVRRDRDGRRDAVCETDAFLAAAGRTRAEQPLEREAVYRDWLCAALERDGAVRLIEASLSAFRRVRVARLDAARKAHSGEKPDASFVGLLEVADPVAFANLLARGVGRHRAFGFGMLLLRPPPRT